MDTDRVAVVIPARNEADSIEACIRSILDDPAGASFDIVVVCNACTDDTETLASAVAPNVRVIVIAEGSKPAALNAGRLATSGVRHYIDADVQVSPGAVSSLTRTMLEQGALAGAPALRIDKGRLSRPVRAFVKQWFRSPYFSDRLIGSGYYALTPDGQDAVGEFPALLNEDWYVSSILPTDSRAVVDSCSFSPRIANNIRELIRIEIRHDIGRRQFLEWAKSRSLAVHPVGRRRVREMLKTPGDIVSIGVFIAVRLITNLEGRRRWRRAGHGWEPAR